jgi:hypothetical protein
VLVGDEPVPNAVGVPDVGVYLTSLGEILKPGPDNEVPVPEPSATISK